MAPKLGLIVPSLLKDILAPCDVFWCWIHMKVAVLRISFHFIRLLMDFGSERMVSALMPSWSTLFWIRQHFGVLLFGDVFLSRHSKLESIWSMRPVSFGFYLYTWNGVQRFFYFSRFNFIFSVSGMRWSVGSIILAALWIIRSSYCELIRSLGLIWLRVWHWASWTGRCCPWCCVGYPWQPLSLIASWNHLDK